MKTDIVRDGGVAPARRLAPYTGWPNILKTMTGLLAIGCIVHIAAATPPADMTPNPALGAWFKSLKRPGSEHPCCSISDCRVTGYVIRNEHFEVKIDGWPYLVPDAAVLHDANNPTREAVVCYTFSAFGPPMAAGEIRIVPRDTVEILCFIPPEATS